MSEPAKLTYLRVVKVDPSTTEYELFRLFDTYGTVDTLFIPANRKRQFAFVSYKLAEDAKNAEYKIDGARVGGRSISVQISEHGPDKDPLCNTMRDMERKRRGEIFPLWEQEERKINCYTRSDYAAEEEAAADGKKENAATERVEAKN